MAASPGHADRTQAHVCSSDEDSLETEAPPTLLELATIVKRQSFLT